jgi:hypothetical protein
MPLSPGIMTLLSRKSYRLVGEDGEMLPPASHIDPRREKGTSFTYSQKKAKFLNI